MSAASQSSQWASQASIEALLKYGPQESVLRQATDTAQQNYQAALDAARTYAAMTSHSAELAREPTQALYDAGRARAQGISDTLAKGFAGLSGPGVDAIKAASLAGQADLGGVLNNEGTAALQHLTDVGVAAKAGQQAGAKSAHDQLVSDLTKVLQSQQDLATQKGAFTALTYDQLHQQAQKLANASSIAAGHDATSRGDAYISAGLDPNDPTKLLPGKSSASKNHGKVSASGAPLQSSLAHENLNSAVLAGLRSLAKGAGKGVGFADTIDRLTNGLPASKGRPVFEADGKTKVLNKDGTQKYTADSPGVKGIPAVAARAAVEMKRNGHVSDKTLLALAHAGYKISSLDEIMTPRQFAKAHPHGLPKPPKKTNAALKAFSDTVSQATGIRLPAL